MANSPYYGRDPVVGRTRLALRDEYVPEQVRVLSGPEDYKLYRRLVAKAGHKGKPNVKPDSLAMAEKKAAFARLEAVTVAADVEPIERKAKYVFDRSKNGTAYPRGHRPKGWVAVGCYTNPNQNR